jgi:hypothetical protein
MGAVDDPDWTPLSTDTVSNTAIASEATATCAKIEVYMLLPIAQLQAHFFRFKLNIYHLPPKLSDGTLFISIKTLSFYNHIISIDYIFFRNSVVNSIGK